MSSETSSGVIRIAHLTFVEEGDGVMVGRPDTGQYALFPAEGAEAVRLLRSGEQAGDVSAWFERETGTPIDLDDLYATLADLGFLAATDAEAEAPTPVRGQRLGRLAFSSLAWLLYVTSALAAFGLMVAEPRVRPDYHSIFFTSHLSLLPIAIATAQPPLMILHEAFHAMAGRRLGLPSKLSIGHRLYFIVAETRLDALYSVPKRQRYLPFLAGMVIDVVVLSWFTIAAFLIMRGGGPGWLSGYLLALGVTVVVRLLWQAFFFLESDVYYVISAVCGCSNLQAAARFRLYRGYRRLRRLPVPDFGEDWTPQDRAASRWYAPLLFVGLVAAGVNLVLFVIPSVIHLASILVTRLGHPATTGTANLVDTAVFLLLALGQLTIVAALWLRDRRRSRAAATAS